MYKSGRKIRYVLKWLLLGMAAAVMSGAVFASALPLLIQEQTLRNSLIRSLSEWSGGLVSIDGPVHIASFSSLSIEADGVGFAATPRLSPLGGIKAKSVTAVLRVPSLLQGRIEFKKVTFDSARFIVNRSAAGSKPGFFGVETAGAALAFAGLSRFERLELQNCTFFVAQGKRRAYRRFAAEHIGVLRSEGALPLTLSVRDQGFEASFHGNPRDEKTASGTFRLAVAPEHPAAEKISAVFAPWEQERGISLTGELTWAHGRASLDDATIAFGDHTARGSLAFAMRHGRPLIEGTLAYDTLEWVPEGRDAGEGARPLLALIAGRSGKESRADLDMRISAEHFRLGPYEAGPVALALTSGPDSFSIDVAELAAFGGKISGRLDHRSGRPAEVTLDAGGTRLDSQSLTSALGWPIAVSGPVTLRLALDMPLNREPLAEDIKAAKGNFGIAFPAGGTLDGDLSSRLSAAVTGQGTPWGFGGSGSFQFNAATIDGAVAPGNVALNLDGEGEGNRVAGSLQIAVPSGKVSGTLTLAPAGEAEDAPPAVPPAPANTSSIALSGTVTALNFSWAGKPALSN